MAAAGCGRNNPFLEEWDTPYGIPPFDKIKESDYMPAIKAGIKQQREEIEAIASCAEAPDFDNVIGAYERSGAILGKVGGVLFNLSETDATPSLQKITEEAIPVLTEHENDIFMNPGFYARVREVYDAKEGLGLSREQEMLLERIYRAFVKNGISLDEEGQAAMRRINRDLAVLSQRFGNNLLAQNNAFAQEFGVSVSEYYGAMASCGDREQRKRMFTAYSSRGNHDDANDNKDILLEIIRLRIERAKLLGYENPAAFTLSDKMAGNPGTVDRFLAELLEAALRRARGEVADMQEIMDEDTAAGLLPEGSVIEPWDWAYYADRVRERKYALNEDDIRPYFKMENVRDGVFATAGRLYGLQFEKIEDAALYHPEAEAFRISDADGSLIGVLLTDYYPRSTKRGGAWMNNIREQEKTPDGENIRPIIVNVGNFTKPSADVPSLLTLDEVSTMFHEFGHALHGLLSQCTYKGISGTSVARDFVELPSQINENWAFQPEVLSGYARHYLTGEVIPDELVEKILRAETFNQGFMTTELVAASILDMKWHELSSVEVPAGSPLASETEGSTAGMRVIDPLKFEAAVCEEMGLIGEIIPRYRTTYFNHIFNSGYDAGYYSYLWAEVLDKDAFELFRQNGIFDKETAMSFRRNILEMGGSEEPMTLYRRFRGADPDPSALLRARGLAE